MGTVNINEKVVCHDQVPDFFRLNKCDSDNIKVLLNLCHNITDYSQELSITRYKYDKDGLFSFSEDEIEEIYGNEDVLNGFK